MLGPLSDSKKRFSDNGLMLSLSLKDKSLKIRLRSDCHSLYLPQKVYAQHLNQREKPFRWDNFDRDIFVDQFLVRKRDVLEYFEQTGQLEKASLYQKLSMGELSKVSGNLSLGEMKDYCHYQGKKLLQTHVYDAAFFHPGPVGSDSERLLVSSRSPYPWTWRKGDSFREKFLEGELKDVQKEHCELLYFKECQKLQELDPIKTGMSWMGIYAGLGVISEVTENTLEPRKNLSLSSNLFSIDSKWHQLGKRVFWDGQGHRLKNFSWGLESFRENILEIPVGFRCMREVF